MDLPIKVQTLIASFPGTFVGLAIAVSLALTVPYLWAHTRARWILSRYPLVNPIWDEAARKKFASSVSELVDEGAKKVRYILPSAVPVCSLTQGVLERWKALSAERPNGPDPAASTQICGRVQSYT